MKKLTLVICIIVFCSSLWAQQKHALVIGNSNYTSLSKLANPINDANDISSVLQNLGFIVDKVLDGDHITMENAVFRMKSRLAVSRNSYGFFFYAGHGIQSNGVNFLIPVGANIPSENFLRDRTLSLQTVLDELNEAGNELNVVVLDACRDNPFSWRRSGNRGLTVIDNLPVDSIIVYSTSAGSIAQDGNGRNGLFTGLLLKNLKTPGLEVKEIFNRTGHDVMEASNRQQIPAIYSQFFGSAYFSKPLVMQRHEIPQSANATIQSSVTSPPSSNIESASSAGVVSAGSITENGITLPFTNVSSFGRWLSGQPNNTVANPYTVKLNVTSLSGISDVLRSFQQKYVYLDFLGSTFTSIFDDTFNQCTNLVSLTIPYSVKHIGKSAFSNCTSLSKVNIHNNVTIIGAYAFSNCISLTNITIEKNVYAIGSYAFSGCTSLISVTFQGTIFPSGFFSGNNSYPTFPGDLRDKFYSTNKTHGTPGTYIRTINGSTWTRH